MATIYNIRESADYIPTAQVRSNKFTLYSVWNGPRSSSSSKEKRSTNMKEQRQKAYSGKFTAGAKKRLMRCVDLMLQAVPSRMIYNSVTGRYQPFKVGFLTLTIPCRNRMYKADELYEPLFKPFTRWLREVKGVKLWVCKCELQKRGQLHYHIMIDKFIPWPVLRRQWNFYLDQLGLMDEFKSENNHSNPNSIDIHSLKKVKNAAAYIAKYMTKDDGTEEYIGGHVWYACEKLKKSGYFTIQWSSRAKDLFDAAIAKAKAFVKASDYYTMVYLGNISPKQLLPLSDLIRYESYLADLRGG